MRFQGDQCLTPEILADVERAIEKRNFIKARTLVSKLGWQRTPRNFQLAGFALKSLGWIAINKRRGNRRTWQRPTVDISTPAKV